MAKSNKTLQTLTEQFRKAQEAEAALEEELQNQERRIQELNSRAGRTVQFKSEKERDTWIGKEVKTLTGSPSSSSPRV